MTRDQKDTATVWMYGGFCLAMLGVYAWSCWLGHRRLDRLNNALIADAKAARDRYEPLLLPVPASQKRRAAPRRPPAAPSDGTGDEPQV